jgi:hypothetical protein
MNPITKYGRDQRTRLVGGPLAVDISGPQLLIFVSGVVCLTLSAVAVEVGDAVGSSPVGPELQSAQLDAGEDGVPVGAEDKSVLAGVGDVDDEVLPAPSPSDLPPQPAIESAPEPPVLEAPVETPAETPQPSEPSLEPVLSGSPCAVETVLVVEDPCRRGRCVEVSVTLPSACVDPPRIDCWRGLLGRRGVTYRWCCGMTVDVIFRLRGDILVRCY